MFFMMGITQGRKNFEHNQVFVCRRCGAYGHYEVFMTYMVLSLFFIPVFKWSKHYYVKTTCCNTVYELYQGVGKRIARGEDVEILPTDLTEIPGMYGYDGSRRAQTADDIYGGTNRGGDSGSGYRRYHRCQGCGYGTEEDFEYCPKCGRRFDF